MLSSHPNRSRAVALTAALACLTSLPAAAAPVQLAPRVEPAPQPENAPTTEAAPTPAAPAPAPVETTPPTPEPAPREPAPAPVTPPEPEAPNVSLPPRSPVPSYTPPTPPPKSSELLRAEDLERRGVTTLIIGGSLGAIGGGVFLPISIVVIGAKDDPYESPSSTQEERDRYDRQIGHVVRLGVVGIIVAGIGAGVFVTGLIMRAVGRSRQRAAAPSRPLSFRF